MSCQGAVYQWIDDVRGRGPHRSAPQATGPAVSSIGMVVARSGALTAVRGRLAPVLGRTEAARRQDRRAAVSAAAAKRGRQRRAPRLRLVSVWRGGGATSLAAPLPGAPLPAGRFWPDPWPADVARPLVAAPPPGIAVAYHGQPTLERAGGGGPAVESALGTS
jgi:hypothetical protein